MKPKPNNDLFLVIGEIEEMRKYYTHCKGGVTYANPPCYNASRDYKNLRYISIDYELEEYYNNL